VLNYIVAADQVYVPAAAIGWVSSYGRLTSKLPASSAA